MLPSWLKSRQQSLTHFSLPYEIRVRVVVGILFILILGATLNSVRLFSDSRQLLKSTIRRSTAESLKRIADFVSPEPRLYSISSEFDEMVNSAGLRGAWVVETSALRSEQDSSEYIDTTTLTHLQRGFRSEKEIAGKVSDGPPVIISASFDTPEGSARNLYYRFESGKGQSLTLVALASADAEARLESFSRLNVVFQILSLLTAAVVAAMLLKITFAPYRRIREDAIKAHLAAPGETETAEFAVEAFQKVISELKQKEQRLQRLYSLQIEKSESLEIYNDYILANMPSGVISCDVAGAITHFNRAAARILHRSREETLGQRYSKEFAGVPPFVSLLDLALQTGEERSLQEVSLRHADGSELSLQVMCRLLHDNRDEVRGAMLLINDLTEIKRLQAEVNLKEQMASLGEMSAGLAHQLRNSLAAMVGFAQLLEKLTAGQEQAGEIAADILREAKTTEEMLRLFLGYASPSEIKKKKISVAVIRDRIEEQFSRLLTEKGITLAFHVTENAPEINCDPLLLANSLANLVQNSCDVCGPGDTIEISLEYLPDRESIRITVADSGPGISNDLSEKIFTPFFTQGKPTGTGLGLSLVRKWIVAHSGEVHYAGCPGKGTAFVIILPDQHAIRPDAGGTMTQSTFAKTASP